MAWGIYRTNNCIEYRKTNLSSRPTINVKLANIKLEEYPNVVTLNIDTGFDGSILVTKDIYEFFEIGELPQKYWRTYKSLIGPIPMRTAKALVSIEPNIKIETYIETPLLGFGKLLAGIELINNLTMILDGPKKRLCIATYEEQEENK